VLNENFPNLGQVIQVEDDSVSSEPKDLTYKAVEAEIDRLLPAIKAMGGTVEVVKVDPLGVVDLRFRGSSKLQTGLELAILDVPMVKHVRFLS